MCDYKTPKPQNRGSDNKNKKIEVSSFCSSTRSSNTESKSTKGSMEYLISITSRERNTNGY